MQLTLGTLAPGFAALALELIDRPFDHRLIGKKGFDELSNFSCKTNQRLTETTELFSIPFCLYAHNNMSIQIRIKKSRKK
jgi:hypothetical protein